MLWTLAGGHVVGWLVMRIARKLLVSCDTSSLSISSGRRLRTIVRMWMFGAVDFRASFSLEVVGY